MSLIGNEIIRLRQVDSTNRYYMDWLTRERPSEGTIIVADSQTEGRGLDGANWESEPGQNLTFSVVLYPEFLAPDGQFYLNKAISLGLVSAVKQLLPGRDDIRIKWPNDIYVGNRKLAGTLIQNGVKGSKLYFAVIGIGLNVNQENFPGEAANPVSLKMLTGNDYRLDQVLSVISDCIEIRYEQLKTVARNELDEEYLKSLFRFGEMAGYIFKGAQIMAKITGVNRYGQLVLQIPGEKILECDLKEIRFEI